LENPGKKTEFVVKKYFKYLVLTSLAILLGFGMRFFKSNIIPMSMLVAWVFL
jgi:hypothetical protein